MPVLLLTTTGRKSGKAHTIPVVYLRDRGNCVIAPGVIEKPAWYFNLKRNPKATIQIGNTVKVVEAQEAGPDERSRLWAAAPAYWNDYQKVARHELPLMVLRPVG